MFLMRDLDGTADCTSAPGQPDEPDNKHQDDHKYQEQRVVEGDKQYFVKLSNRSVLLKASYKSRFVYHNNIYHEVPRSKF